jgi:hypothetical protein
MKSTWWLWLALGAAVIPAAACGSDDPPPASTSASGSGGGGGDGFGASVCWTCVESACAAPVAECRGDPECAAWLDCITACPVGPNGDVDPACSCSPGTGTAAAQAEMNLTICRTSGPGAACAECRVGEIPGDGILNQVCSTSPETNPCYKCEDEKCCDTYADCADDPECKAYQACLVECFDSGSDDCINPCYQAHPAGIEAWAPREACLSVYCFEQGICNDEPLDPCLQCVNANCAQPYADYYSEPAGYLLFACTVPCNDEACYDACKSQYPSAVPLFETFAACSLGSCSAECG